MDAAAGAAVHLRCCRRSSIPLMLYSPPSRLPSSARRNSLRSCTGSPLGMSKRLVAHFSKALHSRQTMSLKSEDLEKERLLMDCGEDQECVLGGIVALGKFDALHIGHRQLAVHASKAGNPFLLSFVGMAEVLGWEYRPPIVAKCDRKRVLSSWAPYCRNLVPLEYQVEFSKVRHLSPRQFVERLAKDLRVSGVVAGENYRFGYRASGDAVELVKLCEEFHLSAFIVSSVMDKAPRSYNGGSISSNDRGQVSSSRVRHALAMGDMEYVAELLGRKHRLVAVIDGDSHLTRRSISLPRSCVLNQPPSDGVYGGCDLLTLGMHIGRCTVTVNPHRVDVELADGSTEMPILTGGNHWIGIEFG